MKKKNWLFFPILFVVGIALFSCNFGNNGNVSSYTNMPAVVTNDGMGGIVLATVSGYIPAPSLTDVMPGDCLYLQQFTVNYDISPVVASDIVKMNVNQSPLEMRSDSVIAGNYTLPISNVTINSYYISPYYQGKIFLGVTCLDANPALRLVYNSKDTLVNGAMNLYLLAQPSSATPNASSYTTLYAFDLSNLIMGVAGRDTTVIGSGTSGSINYRYITANIKYLSAISPDSITPVYTGVTQNPYLVSIFQ